MSSNDDGGREERRFVLRFWRERSGAGHTWRGCAYDVSSALRIASDKPRDLWDFIALRLGRLIDETSGETPENR